jgi:hypothetical protein
MINNPSLEDAKRKLGELEQKLQAARAQYGVVSKADQDWDDMVRAHTEMQGRLDEAQDHSAEDLETLHLDADILRSSFEKWMARTEKNFTQATKR